MRSYQGINRPLSSTRTNECPEEIKKYIESSQMTLFGKDERIVSLEKGTVPMSPYDDPYTQDGGDDIKFVTQVTISQKRQRTMSAKTEVLTQHNYKLYNDEIPLI